MDMINKTKTFLKKIPITIMAIILMTVVIAVFLFGFADIIAFVGFLLGMIVSVGGFI